MECTIRPALEDDADEISAVILRALREGNISDTGSNMIPLRPPISPGDAGFPRCSIFPLSDSEASAPAFVRSNVRLGQNRTSNQPATPPGQLRGHEPTLIQVNVIFRFGPIPEGLFKPLEAWGAFRQYTGKYR